MSTRLYVGNLSFNTNKDSLHAAFATNGREVCFPLDRRDLPEDADVIDEPEDQREARVEESEE